MDKSDMSFDSQRRKFNFNGKTSSKNRNFYQRTTHQKSLKYEEMKNEYHHFLEPIYGKCERLGA